MKRGDRTDCLCCGGKIAAIFPWFSGNNRRPGPARCRQHCPPITANGPRCHVTRVEVCAATNPLRGILCAKPLGHTGACRSATGIIWDCPKRQAPTSTDAGTA